MAEPTLTIGEVARQVGIRTSAIRYYERVGVLPAPERASGQRRYTAETIQRLNVIDVAKRAGFSLEDAKLLLHSTDGGTPASSQLRELAQRKLPEVDALIERAQAMRDWLNMATGCDCDTLDVCGLFDDGMVERTGPPVEGALRLTHVGPKYGVGATGLEPATSGVTGRR